MHQRGFRLSTASPENENQIARVNLDSVLVGLSRFYEFFLGSDVTSITKEAVQGSHGFSCTLLVNLDVKPQSSGNVLMTEAARYLHESSVGVSIMLQKQARARLAQKVESTINPHFLESWFEPVAKKTIGV